MAAVVLGAPLAARWKQMAAQSIARVYGIALVWLPRRPLPKVAWHPGYRRHRAERLCRLLAAMRPGLKGWILGLTSVDISTRQPGFRDHAVFGLADVGGPAAVLSIYRLSRRKGKGASLRRRQQHIWRALLLHEVGHLHGLPHCSVPTCPMFDAQASIPALLRMKPALCRH